MQSFRVHILGCGSAVPTERHNPSSQVVEVRGKLFMVDCGEGTQLQVRRSKFSFSKLYAIFITHLHGDHVLGLVGMLSTFGLNGRTAPLHVYAPKEYEKLFGLEMDMFCSTLDYDIIFHGLDTTKQQVVYEDRSISVETLPLRHRGSTCGFLFREHPGLKHIKRDMVDFYGIPISQINNIKAGLDWTSPDGEIVKNELLTSAPDPVRTYAYCSDTRYIPQLADMVKGVNLLYHEATYGEDNKEMAEKYLHSTAREAAMVARDSGAKKLMIGHFSKRYRDENVLLDEAKAVFENTILANERLVVEVE